MKGEGLDETTMKIGLIPVNVGTSSAEAMTGLAQLAEGIGFESLWTFEHAVVPVDYFLPGVGAVSSHTNQVCPSAYQPRKLV